MNHGRSRSGSSRLRATTQRWTLLLAVSAAGIWSCEGSTPDAGLHESSLDAAATNRESRASLSGDAAPGAQSYSYRGLYAGMSRARLETHVPRAARPDTACHPSTTAQDVIDCHYDAVLGSDSAAVALDVSYAAESGRDTVARTITALRALPIDVDGVRLSHLLADAFERQTSLLDRRDVTFGRNAARVRMGTVNGARQNFVDVTVETRSGREWLTVRLSRGAEVRPTRSPARASKP